jgi:hypothetical protein
MAHRARNRTAGVAAIGVLAISLAACGGGGGGSDAQAQQSPSAASNPNLAYAIVIDIPSYEGKSLQQFSDQLCNHMGHSPSGGKPAPDYLATIDLQQGSPTYGQVISRDPVPYEGPELHHMSIDAGAQRVALYDLYQNKANIFDVGSDPRHPKFLRVVDLAEKSREMLGPVAGLHDASGNPVKVGYAMPHVADRLANGNFLISMGGVYAPELPKLHLGAPGGFIEMTPDGDVVRAFPSFTYSNGKLSNGLYPGKGVMSVDTDDRLGMMAHAELMSARDFLCGGLVLKPKAVEPGNQVVLWKTGPNAADPTVFQTVTLPTPFVTAPAFVHHPVNGMDIIYVTTFSSGLYVLHRPTGTDQKFELSQAYKEDSPHGLVHMRLHPSADVLYISDPYGNTLQVLDFSKDPLHPAMRQMLSFDEVHMMKFSPDGDSLFVSNGLASILGFELNSPPFKTQKYGLTQVSVAPDGTLTPGAFIFDGQNQPNAPHRAFIGDFFLRLQPQPFV